jgi:hypothetical protein
LSSIFTKQFGNNYNFLLVAEKRKLKTLQWSIYVFAKITIAVSHQNQSLKNKMKATDPFKEAIKTT